MTRNEVTQWAESLGTTADEVATTLRDLGIKGTRGDCSACPIARAFIAKFGVKPGDVITTNRVLQWHDGKGYTSINLPDACKSFVILFDTYSYPVLEEPFALKDEPCTLSS